LSSRTPLDKNCGKEFCWTAKLLSRSEKEVGLLPGICYSYTVCSERKYEARL